MAHPVQDTEVVHQTTYVNYGLQSLISEVGGVLGITLGLSALCFLNLVSSNCRRKCFRSQTFAKKSFVSK